VVSAGEVSEFASLEMTFAVRVDLIDVPDRVMTTQHEIMDCHLRQVDRRVLKLNSIHHLIIGFVSMHCRLDHG